MDGTPFGRYRLVELLGRGGMGEVWRAHDTETDRIVAIKLLPAELSDSEDFQRRFRREAHTVARLNSPHIIPIHNYGEIDGRLYLDMRLIEGHDLHTVLTRGPLPPDRAVHIIDQIAKALHAAHKVGLVHRDIKPSNILLDDEDFAYLIDFGVARAAGDTRLTGSRTAVGTWHYIAPERLGGQTDEDARADIYSLACVLYECLTARPPFAGGDMAQLITAHLSAPPPRASLTRPDVPPRLDDVIARGMAKDPNHRYANTIGLAQHARQAISTPPQRPHRPPQPPRPAPTPSSIPGPVLDYDRPPQPSPRPWAQPAVRHAPQPVANPAAYFQQPVRQAPPKPSATPPPRAAAAAKAFTEAPKAIAKGVAAPVAKPKSSARLRRRPNRRTTIALAASAVVILVLAVLAIPTMTHQDSHPSQSMLPFPGLDVPWGVAVDSAGNLYVSDSNNNRILKLPAGSSTAAALPFTGLSNPFGAAVDSKGNVYVTDKGNNRVLKLAEGSSTATELPFTGLKGPWGVAVDPAGTLYVTDYFNNRVLKLAAGASTQTELPFTGLSLPHGVAVDPNGNVYITDTGNNRVLRLAAGSSSQTELPFSGLNAPWGVTVDPAGNLYITDYFNNRVLKLPADTSTQIEVPFSGLNNPAGVAVSGSGTLYVVDGGNNNGRVLQLTGG